MTEKVLISLDELRYFMRTSYSMPFDEFEGQEEIKNRSDEWFHAQPEAPQWISVEDRLPTDNQEIFVKLKDKIYSGKYWKGGFIGDCFRLDKAGNVTCYKSEITHWMPIPSLPELTKIK